MGAERSEVGIVAVDFTTKDGQPRHAALEWSVEDSLCGTSQEREEPEGARRCARARAAKLLRGRVRILAAFACQGLSEFFPRGSLLDRACAGRFHAVFSRRRAAPAGRVSNTFAPDPLTDDAGLTFATFDANLRSEDPDLINPYHEDPEPFFKWDADKVLGEVEITSAVAGGRGHERAESTIDLLGLNREKLKQLRWQTYQLIDTLCLTLGAGLPQAVHQQVERSVQSSLEDKEAFAAMNRHLVRQVHGLPL